MLMKFFNRKSIFYSMATLLALAAACFFFFRILTNDTRKETEAQMRDLSNQSLTAISQKL